MLLCPTSHFPSLLHPLLILIFVLSHYFSPPSLFCISPSPLILTIPLLSFNLSPLQLLFRPPCFYPSRYLSPPIPILYFTFPLDFQRSLYFVSILRPFVSYFAPLAFTLPVISRPPSLSCISPSPLIFNAPFTLFQSFAPSPLISPPCFYLSRYSSPPLNPILHFTFPFDFKRSPYFLSIFRPFASYFTPLLLPLPLLFAPP